MKVPLCARCKCPMPRWAGACFSVDGVPMLCEKCFKEGLRRSEPQNSGFGALSAIQPAILGLISGREGRKKSVALLALAYSVQEANEQGIFSDPLGLLKRAIKTLSSREGYYASSLQDIRKFLIIQKLWIPVGEQKRGKRLHGNRMRLGEKVLAVVGTD